MIEVNLRKIEAELGALIESAGAEHLVDPHALWIIARKIGAQAEMLENGLDQS